MQEQSQSGKVRVAFRHGYGMEIELDQSRLQFQPGSVNPQICARCHRVACLLLFFFFSCESEN